MTTPEMFIVVTVTTILGTESTHTYHVPASAEEAEARINEIVESVWGPLLQRGLHMTQFHPSAIYNVAHIVKVEVKSSGSEKLQTSITEKTMGFLRPR